MVSKIVDREWVERHGYNPHANHNGEDVAQPEGRTELANSKRLLDQSGDEVRWCSKWRKFLVYDGRRWEVDQGERVEAMAKLVAESLWQQVADEAMTTEANELKSLVGFARNSSSARGIAAMVQLARSDSRIMVEPDQLDADPWLLNVANGTVDLRTGQLRSHRRSDLLTKICPVKFDPAAPCPTFERAVRTIFANQDELVGYLQRLRGFLRRLRLPGLGFLCRANEYAASWDLVRGNSMRLPSTPNTANPCTCHNSASASRRRRRSATCNCFSSVAVQRRSSFMKH